MSGRRCLHGPTCRGSPPPPPHHPHHYPPPPPHFYQHPPPPPHHFHHPPPHHHHHHPPPPPPHYYYEYYYGLPRRTLPIGSKRVHPYEEVIDLLVMDNNSAKNIYHLSFYEWFRFARIFAAKLVLEVFGAAGAIWGFAEVIALRTSETQEFWRMNACIVGVIFFLRYLCHAREYLFDLATDRLTTMSNSLELRVDDQQTIVEDQRDELAEPTADNNNNEVNVSLIGHNEAISEQLNTV